MNNRSFSTFWCVGAIAAVAMHAGSAVLAYSSFNAEDPDVDDGAPAIEISIVLASPAVEPSDLPPGSEADASTAAAAAVQQTAAVQETSLPKDVPTETEEPDQVVTQQQVTEPIESEQDHSKVQTQASAEAVASEATAPPKIEAAQAAPKAAAPVQGSGQSANRVIASWQRKLVTHLDRHKKYPADSDRRTAELVVGFTLDRLGQVLSASIVKSSGHAKFDEAAIAMLKRADPLPAPPPIVADDGLSFTVPVVFRVKG